MVWEEDVPHRRFSKSSKKQGNMKRITNLNPLATRSAFRGFLTPTLAVVAVATALLNNAVAGEISLTTVGSDTQTVPADFGGDGLVANYHTHPSGTGVFDPFLTLERDPNSANPGIERAYNTDGQTGGVGGANALYLDQQRPSWNTIVKLSDLAILDPNNDGGSYYAFELDANEPGSDKSLISIDNVRIYTSSSDNTLLVQSDEANLDSLGNLRWAMNHPLTPQGTDTTGAGDYNIDNWIKLDSNLSDAASKANGGSGYSDLILYVPTDAFKEAIDAGEDYLWFYNLNGVHYTADGDLAAQAGYEEWRAVSNVPDGGNTLVLFGTAIAALGVVGGRRKLTMENIA
jgi:hypothetical protein